MTTRRLSEVLASSPSQAKQIALRLAARGYAERGGGAGPHRAHRQRPRAGRRRPTALEQEISPAGRADRGRRARARPARARQPAVERHRLIGARFARGSAGDRHHQLLDPCPDGRTGRPTQSWSPGLRRGRPAGGRAAAGDPGRPILADDPGGCRRPAGRHGVRRAATTSPPRSYGADRHPAPVSATSGATRSSWRCCAMRSSHDVPVLGICRGIQLINVACGGTLEQHIDEQSTMRPHRQDDTTYGCTRSDTEPGTRLRRDHRRAGAGALAPPPGRRPRGRRAGGRPPAADDGLIEGIEHPARRFCVAVLWHPDAEPAGHGAPLFRALVSSSS